MPTELRLRCTARTEYAGPPTLGCTLRVARATLMRGSSRSSLSVRCMPRPPFATPRGSARGDSARRGSPFGRRRLTGLRSPHGSASLHSPVAVAIASGYSLPAPARPGGGATAAQPPDGHASRTGEVPGPNVRLFRSSPIQQRQSSAWRKSLFPTESVAPRLLAARLGDTVSSDSAPLLCLAQRSAPPLWRATRTRCTDHADSTHLGSVEPEHGRPRRAR